jgi:RNA polymerase sigma factor (sigma-70 family)
MATGSAKSGRSFVGQLRRALLLSERHVLTDSRLLESFRLNRDEAAFEILVKRHGPMVLGVCRRVIGNVHDAEDAFQAVFLVLAKKAHAITQSDLIGNWLYGVAYRTALQARGRLGRRRAREMQVKDMPQPTIFPDYDLRDLHEALDQELSKLPDKYRVPIILCDLEGRPRKKVASQLKLPEGTLSSRLATGRRLLGRRLQRYGLVVSGGGVAAALAQQAAAAVRTGLVAAAVDAAALTAAGQSAAGLLSAEVVTLSQGVMKTMLLHKLKLISLVCLGLMLGVCAGFGVSQLRAEPAALADQGEQPVSEPKAAARDEEPIDGALLLNQQIQAALQLSKNQVNKLQAVSQSVDAKNESKQQEIQQIQKQIEELRKQIAKLQKRIDGEDQQIGTIRTGIEGQRKQALAEAAPDILSARAMKRLREIHRQRRGLRALLQDPKVQQMLKIDDEQVRKIEGILKDESAKLVWDHVVGADVPSVVFLDYDADGWADLIVTERPRRWYRGIDGIARQGTWPNEGVFVQDETIYMQTEGSLKTWTVRARTRESNDQKLMEVLTDAQRKTLLDWLGEPYQSPSWQRLWEKYANKKR